MRNVLTTAQGSHAQMVSAAIGTMFAQPDAVSVAGQF
jgi:hypothetical protein